MRTYGRVTNENGTKTWIVVTTDANGFNDEVYATTLAQCLKLNLGEDPFYAAYGIPTIQSVQQQIAPDYNVALTQTQFALYFASLIIAKTTNNPPTYQVNAVTHQGYMIDFSQLPQ